MREWGTYKVDSDGDERPFGGLNVLFVCDIWQLDPRDGLPLGAVPKEYQVCPSDKAAHATGTHGGHISGGVQN